MSFPKYEEYEDSGVQWIQKIPNHWLVSRLKNIFTIRKRIAGDLGHDVLSVTNKGVKVKDTESGDGQLSSDYSKYQLVAKGDFAMNHMDLLTGYVDVSGFDGVTSPDYRVFCLSQPERDEPRFMLRLLQNAYHQKLFFPFGQGSAHLGRWRLPTDEFNGFLFPRPPLAEQKKIARFLDHETARIDTLISEQQRLIELLKEKRQAVISHAVTKGLDPDAPMRDSGVEWLGEIPARWTMTKVGYVANVARGTGYQNVEEVDESDEALQMIRISDFNNFDPIWVRRARTLDSFIVGSTDLLIAGTGASAGITMQVTDGMADMIHSYNAPRIRCFRIDPAFLFFVLNSQGIQQQEDVLFTGSAQHFLDIDSISKLEFPCCGHDEQKQIVSHLNGELGNFDRIIADSERAIILLQERRSALISAAVTGKIDVRNWQPVESNTNEERLQVPEKPAIYA